MIVASVALALVPTYGAVRIAQVEQQILESESLRVGLVQANMDFLGMRRDPLEGLRRHLEQSDRLERLHQPDLLVWSESA